MLATLQKLFFWNYPRSSWQWDALCVVILIFIFLTPKNWFDNSERSLASAHQSPTATSLTVGTEVVEKAGDRRQLEDRLKTFTGRRDLQVLDVHKVLDSNGRTVGYQIDIR